MSSKVLLVFCDGTGMDGNLAEGDVGSGIRHVSNVLRLSRAVKQFTSDGRNQVVFYQSGVGSETDFQGNPVLGRMGALMQQAFGLAVASKIGDVYAFIAQNFEPKDDICIFGFSRVAYTARVVADLIDQIGLLCLENLGHFFSIWRQLLDGKEPTIPEGTRWTPIKCVGVWDTICSVPKDRNAARSRNTDLPASVDIALHALSLHENRDKFRPKLWTVPKHGLAPRGMDGKQVFKQVWFPGAHSDVGGGYERHELADISLFWMAGEVCDFINLDLEFIQRSAQRSPEPWGKSQPHNAWKEAPWHFKRFIHSETRLQSHDIKQDALFHSSVLVSPTTVRKAQNMITSKTLRKRFGERWKPRIVELNSFEKRCKTDWEEPPNSDEAEIKFETSSDLVAWEPSVGTSAVHDQCWCWERHGKIPRDAVRGGREADGRVLYVARIAHEGGLHPGKASPVRCWITHDDEEIFFGDGYEILTGQSYVKWVTVRGRFAYNLLKGSTPVRAGRHANGQPLYIAQAEWELGIHCGEVSPGSFATIPYNWRSRTVRTYRVLVFA